MRYFIALFIVTGLFALTPHAFADCDINTDWTDAPCMDQIVNNTFPQHQVDRWAEYYDYKGAAFMESKKLEMNAAIQDNTLSEWVDKSIQNQNVWRYYYFSGEATNPFPYMESVGFETIQRSQNNTPALSPLKQIKAGISPEKIVCREGLELILRSSDDLPACVTPETKQKLIERGWAQSKQSDYQNMTMQDKLKAAKRLITMSRDIIPFTTVGVDEKNKTLRVDIFDGELTRLPNAREYYEEKIKEIIPFDVPVKIGFSEYWKSGGSNDVSPTKSNLSCDTVGDIKKITDFNIKLPTYLPQNYVLASCQAIPFEAQIMYNDERLISGYQKISIGDPKQIANGAIYLYIINKKGILGEEQFTREIGNTTSYVLQTIKEVNGKNPSLKMMEVNINGIIGWANERCETCGMQTANFDNNTIVNYTPTPSRIKFYDENGVVYFFQAGISLNELIKVAESIT